MKEIGSVLTIKGKKNKKQQTAVTHAMVAGKSIVEFSDGKVSNAIKGIWHKVEQTLKG